MLKKALHEKAFGTDGWFSFDPADIGFIEAIYKKTIREGEERLMLAVLEVPLNTSRSTSLHGTLAESSYFKKRRSGF